MHDDRSADALTDSSIEREIEAALAMEPSPEFLARVRARVATEPATAAWRLPWTLAACGAMAMMIVMVVVFSRSEQKTSPTRGDISLAPAPAIVPDQALAAAPTTTRVREALSPVGRVRSRATVRPTEPEVLVSRDEAAALRRLFASVRQGRVDLSLLGEFPPAATELRPLNEIDITPITIEPLTPVAGGEGVRQ